MIIIITRRPVDIIPCRNSLTSMEDTRHTSDYQEEFDTQAYLEFYNELFDVNNYETGLLEFRMKSPHLFWSNFQACTPADEFGICCLEYGGGPSIANLISVVPKVDRIVFAEYIETSSRIVDCWKSYGL